MHSIPRRARIGGMFEGWVAAAAVGVSAAATIGGAYMSSSAAKNAAQTQSNSANYAAQLQFQEFQQQQQNLQPYLQAGQFALGNLQKGLQPGGQYNQQFTAQQFQLDPGYQFAKQQGEQAIKAQSAATGTSTAPSTAEGLASFNQGLAAQQYNSAYSRWYNNEQNQLAAQFSLANLGQGSSAQFNEAAQSYANNAGSLIVGAGNATAAGQVAGANAWGGALSGLANQGLSAYMFNQLGSGGYGGGNQFSLQDVQTLLNNPNTGTMSAGGGYTYNTPT